MKVRSLAILIVCACLVLGSELSVFGQGQRTAGPPPGGVPPAGAPPPPPGGPPAGGIGPGGPARHSPGASGAHRQDNAPHSSVQFGPVGRWWDDKSVIGTIGLRAEQQKKMDTIFDANKPAILASYKTFLSKQSKLTALNKDPHVDQTRLFAAIDAVNQARASLQKATAQMLLQIRQQMDPDQIEKVEKLQ